MPQQTDFRQTLQEVAKRSASLGYKVNHNASKHNQLQLAFQSLKVVINDEVISSHFYIEDTIYNKVNYPGFKDIKSPLGADNILKVLDKLKQRYEHIIEMHQQVLKLGGKIDDLRTRMSMTGLIDKSVKDSSNLAENLVEAPTGITHDPANVTKRMMARLIDAGEFKSYVKNYLRLLRKRDPARYQRYLIQLHKSLQSVHDSADNQPMAPSTVTRTPKNVLAPNALPSALSASQPVELKESTPIELITSAIKTVRSLRKLRVDPALRQVGRSKYMLMLSIVPRNHSMSIVFTPRDVNKLGHELHAKTGFNYKFVEIILKATRIALAYQINLRR
jgi:hypothetical protein